LGLYFSADIWSTSDYYPFGMGMGGRSWSQNQDYRFGFNGKEGDDEIKGDGNSYDFGARMYDSRIGRWMSLDPAAKKYPEMSPYVGIGNNPILLVDPDGREIDLSNLSDEEKSQYGSTIKLLKESKIFRTYYRRLEKSETVYFIHWGSGSGGGGSYNPQTNEVHTKNNDPSVWAEELFHAYQSDLGVYSRKDRSVRETEGDLVGVNVGLAVGDITKSNIWDQGIGLNSDYVDNFSEFSEGVLSESFDEDFSKAVDARIEFYKEQEKYEGLKAPRGYIQPNSGQEALALKKVIRESDQSLVGPRLSNGDFFTN
jgi:RHS repeat-associated protein